MAGRAKFLVEEYSVLGLVCMHSARGDILFAGLRSYRVFVLCTGKGAFIHKGSLSCAEASICALVIVIHAFHLAKSEEDDLARSDLVGYSHDIFELKPGGRIFL